MLLVDICRPEIIVELGTHCGDSYCAFCQAVEQIKIPTRCYAVDSWQGDIHTGQYGVEVLENLRLHHDAFYSNFSKLMQSTFDEAVNYFKDDSIDILHIDGCHTYQAVKHDFYNWLPKLKKNGIVLFHDICERRNEFGVYLFWDELKTQYPNFEFFHSSGLGVLSTSKQYSSAVSFLFEADSVNASILRRFFSCLGDRITDYKTGKDKYLATRNELSATRNELSATRNELSATRNALSEIQQSKMFRINRLFSISLDIIKKEGLIRFCLRFIRWLVKRLKRTINKDDTLERTDDIVERTDDTIDERFIRWNKKNRLPLSDDERDYRFITEEIYTAVKKHNEIALESKEQNTSLFDNSEGLRVVAFYLPQFHPIPENDVWWSKGFTEWTNVKKAKPNFAGHYQPRVPTALGYYDLRDPNLMERQVALAKKYGIYGFCYYYYWFDGKRLLETPLESMLATNKPDFPFCLCWANENWTKKWDGGNNEILIEERYSSENDEAVIYDLIRYMRSPNYIRISGQPLLLIYRANHFPDIQRTISLWKIICEKEGIGEPYLAMMESGEYANSPVDPTLLGFQAGVEFPPHNNFVSIKPPRPLLNTKFEGNIVDYREALLACINKEPTKYTRFRTATTSWDNTARLQNNPMIHINSSPGAFQAWLEFIIRHTRDNYEGDERLVFINAWNEWAEAAYLEPDEKYGHKYLEATYKAINGVSAKSSNPLT